MIKALKEIITDNIRFFYSILDLAAVNQKRMYKSSDLGWFWSFVKPLLYLCIFYVAISIGFKHAKDVQGIICPYFIWLVSGMVPWFYMRSMIVGGAGCFRKFKALITKSIYPASIFPTTVAFSFLYVHAGMVIICIILCLFSGVYPSIYWLQIPIYTLFMVLLSIIWNTGAGLLAVVSGDFMDLLRAVNPAFFWLSGILFNSRGQDVVSDLFFQLNPITYIVEGYRDAFCYHQWLWEDMESFGYFLLVLAVLTCISLWLYKKLRRSLPDIL
ncbi:MAG: ABC transporter permease [Firmicutes bacterium]|nr:ABC transporter permease [Bacillota bacterium]